MSLSQQTLLLFFAAPVHRVHIVQEKDRITCSSERIYPKPTLSWSSSPQEAHKAEAELMEEQLYRISSTIAASSSTQENHSCTVSAGRSTRRTTLFQPRRPFLLFPEGPFWSITVLSSFISGHINASDDETTLSCFTSDPRATQLTWRFNHTQVIVTRTGTGGNYTTSDGWSKLVKNVSPSGDLQLEHLSPSEEGTFTCELSGDLETYVTSTQLTFSGHPGEHVEHLPKRFPKSLLVDQQSGGWLVKLIRYQTTGTKFYHC